MRAFSKHLIHTIAKIAPIENILYMLARNQNPDNLLVKLIAPPNLYSQPTTRKVVRKGIKLSLDLSDLIGWYAFFEVCEPGHDALLELIKKDSVVLDVGCNIGITALRSALKASNGYVHAFEASKETYLKCAENLRINNLKNLSIYHLAVGEREGFVEIKSRDIHNKGMNQAKVTTNTSADRVQMISIDNFCHENQVKPDIIKIDTEGFELKILKGAVQVIRQNRPTFFIEVDKSNLIQCGDSVDELISFLKNEKYILVDAISKKEWPTNEAGQIHCDIIAFAN